MTMEENLKGKKPIRLAISKPGSSHVWVFEKVMEHYGLSYKDWEAAGARFFRGSYSEQAGAFKDRNVDGTFTFLALPGASITEASVGRDLKILAFPKPLLEFLGKFGMGRASSRPARIRRRPTATSRWSPPPWAPPSRWPTACRTRWRTTSPR